MLTQVAIYVKRSPLFWGCLILFSIGIGVWQWLGVYPQPLFLTWGNEQFETTFQTFVFSFSLVCLGAGLLLYIFFRLIMGLVAWSAHKQLNVLLEGVSAFYQDNTPLLEQKLDKMKQWKQSPWWGVATLLFARARHLPSGEALNHLQAFPKTQALVMRSRIESLLERDDISEAVALLRVAFEKNPRNIWILTQFFQVALRRKDETTAAILLRSIRKYHPSSSFQKQAQAHFLFLQAEKAYSDDPLRHEFLLREAFKQAPDDVQIARALLQVLLNQAQEDEALRLAALFWPINPDLSFIRLLLDYFRKEGESSQFQKVHSFIGEWARAPYEVACLSALLLGYTAGSARLWNTVHEVMVFLSDKKPLWVAFLRLREYQVSHAPDKEVQEIEDLLIAGDPILTQLMQPL